MSYFTETAPLSYHLCFSFFRLASDLFLVNHEQNDSLCEHARFLAQDSFLFIYKMFHLDFSGRCKYCFVLFLIDFKIRVFSHDIALNIKLSWLVENLKLSSEGGCYFGAMLQIVICGDNQD